jgi:hypothetical protein
MIEQEMFGELGSTNQITGQIYIDKDLRRFPKLRFKVIKHELNHRALDKNLIQGIIRDIRDYPKVYFDSEYWQWVKYKKRHQNKSFIAQLLIAYQNIVYFGIIFPYAIMLRFFALAFQRHK